MDGIDPFITISGGCLAVLVILAGWATVQYELNTVMPWRIAKYASNVLALVLGFGLGQSIALKVAAMRGIDSGNMAVTLLGFFAGSFVVMWAVQAVEYIFRARHGLEPMPYRLVRFDLFRW